MSGERELWRRDCATGISASSPQRPRGRIYVSRRESCDARGPTERSRRYCGVAMSPKNRPDAPPSRSDLGGLSAGAEAAGGEITDRPGPVGRRAAPAVPPRLFLRRTSRSYGARTNECETSARDPPARARRRVGSAGLGYVPGAFALRQNANPRARNFRTRRRLRARRHAGCAAPVISPAHFVLVRNANQ